MSGDKASRRVDNVQRASSQAYHYDFSGEDPSLKQIIGILRLFKAIVWDSSSIDVREQVTEIFRKLERQFV
jgi:hypothetical protein